MTDRLGGIGSALFVVLGDAAGWLYFFTPAGHLLHEYNTGEQHPAAAVVVAAAAAAAVVVQAAAAVAASLLISV